MRGDGGGEGLYSEAVGNILQAAGVQQGRSRGGRGGLYRKAGFEKMKDFEALLP